MASPAPTHLPDRLVHDTLPLVVAHTVLRIDPRRVSRPDTLEARTRHAIACLPTNDDPVEVTPALLNVALDTYADVRRGRPAGLTPPSTTLIRERAARVRGDDRLT